MGLFIFLLRPGPVVQMPAYVPKLILNKRLILNWSFLLAIELYQLFIKFLKEW